MFFIFFLFSKKPPPPQKVTRVRVRVNLQRALVCLRGAMKNLCPSLLSMAVAGAAVDGDVVVISTCLLLLLLPRFKQMEASSGRRKKVGVRGGDAGRKAFWPSPDARSWEGAYALSRLFFRSEKIQRLKIDASVGVLFREEAREIKKKKKKDYWSTPRESLTVVHAERPPSWLVLSQHDEGWRSLLRTTARLCGCVTPSPWCWDVSRG